MARCRQAAPKWVPRPAPAPEKVPEPAPEEPETNDEAQGLENHRGKMMYRLKMSLLGHKRLPPLFGMGMALATDLSRCVLRSCRKWMDK